MIRRLTTALAGAALTAGLLAGCAGTSYPPETAEALQQKVLTVSQTVAAGDLPGARAQLDELQASIDEALEDERITTERHDDIATAITLVRTDLDAAIAQQAQQAAEAAAEQARLEQEEAQRQQEEAQRRLEEQQAENEKKQKEEEEKKQDEEEKQEEDEEKGNGKGED